MVRFLESRIGQGVQGVLRVAERRVFPKFGKERDFYEYQQNQLTNPLTRGEYVRNLSEKILALIPEQNLPEISTLKQYETTPDMFLNPQQVYTSQHNIAHHAIVMVGAMLGSRYLQKENPEENGQINEPAILIASALHDTQRNNDGVDSVKNLPIHGRVAAEKAEQLISLMHMTVDQPTLMLIQQILTYHDIDRKQLGPNYTPELGIVVAADRAAIGRLFSSHETTSRIAAGLLGARRMRNFKNGGIASDPSVFATLIECLSALDIMTKDKIAHGDVTQEFAYVLESAQELGIVKVPVLQEQKAAV